MDYRLNLRHLRAFAAIVRLGSASRAAISVHLTQPAITQALTRLEAQLGQPLFVRTPAGMLATEAGTLLAPRVEAALAHIGSPNVTMSQLRALIALADCGSYAAAARTTGLAQPSLHRAIQDLSVMSRRSLAARSGRGLLLTETGRRMARAFRLARAELEAGLDELAALDGRETGRITVGAMPLSRARLLPAAVVAFNRLHPQATIAIIEGSRAELIEPLRDGAIDLMVGALRGEADTSIVEQPLFDDRPSVIGRFRHPLAGTAPTPAALADYPWIVAAPGTPLHVQWEKLFDDAATPRPPVPIECGSVLVIRQILRETDFLTLLSPDQVAVELDDGLLSAIAYAPQLSRTIGITTRAGWRPTPLQQAFATLLATPSASTFHRQNL